jgi:hypothetical protein
LLIPGGPASLPLSRFLLVCHGMKNCAPLFGYNYIFYINSIFLQYKVFFEKDIIIPLAEALI